MQAHKHLTIFEQAVVNSILREYENLLSEQDLPYEFSRKYQRWVNRLLQKTRISAWCYVNTAFKKAVIVAIIIGLLTITAMAVPAIRETIIGFFFTDRPDSYEITFDPEQAETAPDKIDSPLFPTVIDEAFILIDQSATQVSVNGLWINEEGAMSLFSQEIIPHDATSDTWVGIDAEGATRTRQIIGEYLVEILWLEESYSLHWTNNLLFLQVFSILNNNRIRGYAYFRQAGLRKK